MLEQPLHSTMPEKYYVGVDVGTQSVRAALVTQHGKVDSTATHPIDIHEPEPNFYEQSSENIWEACCRVVQSVTAGVSKSDVCGIGFDATCSLVVLDKHGDPLSISPSGSNHWNVIMWMDHRAEKQARDINLTKHEVLDNVGGTISLEMETPKLLWLKQNMPDQWAVAGHFFDLPDYLTWRATNSSMRSLCSLVCKWTYQPTPTSSGSPIGWSENYLQQIGLDDLCGHKGSAKIGSGVQSPGVACGDGLTEEAATKLDLSPGTPVATSMIDAYAGAVGCLACQPGGVESTMSTMSLSSKMAITCGTSTCHIALSEKRMSVPGVWGPFFSVLTPGYYVHEGGQSTAGKLLDHIIEKHAAYSWVKQDADSRKVHIFDILQEVLEFKTKKDECGNVAELTKELHVWPDFHGNRAPLADPTLKGMISGLSLSSGVEDLAVLYLATIQALAYSSKQIVSVLTLAGHDIWVLYACGGLAKCKLYIQTHADVLGLPVVIPDETESVLLGSAILAATASGHCTSIQDAMITMGGDGSVIQPDPATKSFHAKKYEVFECMVQHQRQYKRIMADL